MLFGKCVVCIFYVFRRIGYYLVAAVFVQQTLPFLALALYSYARVLIAVLSFQHIVFNGFGTLGTGIEIAAKPYSTYMHCKIYGEESY